MDLFSAGAQGILRNQSESIPGKMQYMQHEFFPPECHESRGTALPLQHGSVIIWQLFSVSTRSRYDQPLERHLNNFCSSCSQDIFSELCYTSITLDQVLNGPLLKRAKKVVESKQDTSCSTHKGNLSAHDLDLIAKISADMLLPKKFEAKATKETQWAGAESESSPAPKPKFKKKRTQAHLFWKGKKKAKKRQGHWQSKCIGGTGT